jgi:hypothetical protein
MKNIALKTSKCILIFLKYFIVIICNLVTIFAFSVLYTMVFDVPTCYFFCLITGIFLGFLSKYTLGY